MKKAALILGAGSSKAFGIPLTNEIFPRIWKKLHQKRLLRKDARRKLIRLVNALYPGLAMQRDPAFVPNIIEVLSMVDHLIENQNTILARFGLNDLTDCRRYLEIATIKIIEEDFYDYDPANRMDMLYDQFIDWIYRNRTKRQFNIISTNYDIAIEYGLNYYYKYEEYASKVDFGISWRDPITGKMRMPPVNPVFGIYKLHGSTNWLKCPLCNQVYIHTQGNIYNAILTEEITDANSCHCGHGPLESLIVSPSLERDVRDVHLRYVWSRAGEQLRTAKEWIFIGYSMPPEDLNIKSILIRAFNARKIKPKITVVQYDKDDKNFRFNKGRFQTLFGAIDYHRNGLEGFMSKSELIEFDK